MVLTFVDGSQAVTSAETDLFSTVTADKHFACWVFCHNMAAGDTYKARIYVYDQNAGAERVYKTKQFTFEDLAGDPAVFLPFVPSKRYRVSLQKIAGTDRTFTWQRVEA